MKIQSWSTNYYGYDEVGSQDVEDFVAESLILKDGKQTLVQFATSEQKIPLEKQPTEIARAFGKLVDVLASKGILNCEEIQEIVDRHLNQASFVKE